MINESFKGNFKRLRQFVMCFLVSAVLVGSFSCSRTATNDAKSDTVDPNSAIAVVNPPTRTVVITRVRDMPFEQLVNVTSSLLDEFWRKSFKEVGWTNYNTPKALTPYAQPIKSGCGILPMKNAFYCSRDHSIYYDDAFVRAMYLNPGDFSAVTVLAHEWGHAVQKDLGVIGGEKSYYPIQTELQADCYSGAFAKYIFELGYLEEGDLKEGGSTLLNLGDRMDSKWFDPQAHGTPFQRVEYYNRGWEKGIRGCVAQS
jgi:predicted metalloprotease